MQTAWVTVGCAALLLSGCVIGPFPSGPSKNPTWWSSTWSEPGLYGQLASLDGSPPAGFSIARESAEGLPFPDAAFAELDWAQPSEVRQGNYKLWLSTRHSHMRCDCVAIDFLQGHPRDTPSPEEATREGFLSLARQVVDTDQARLQSLADAFMTSCEVRESGQQLCGVVIPHPLTFSAVEAVLDAAGAEAVPLTNFGIVERAGAGFKVAYQAPLRVMQGEHLGQRYRLEVVPYDQVRFNHYGDLTDGGVNVTEVRDALSTFMAALGRQPPGNATFDFSRW